MHAHSTFSNIQQTLRSLNPADDNYAAQFVDRILAAGHELGASDIHVRPMADGLEVGLRIDGVLQSLGAFPSGKTTDVVTRLKVLANLLTYRTDVPQEGRIHDDSAPIEMRVSTFPMLHGETAVVRLFAADAQLRYLNDLGFPDEIHNALDRLLGETSGAFIVTGPAGSGKTTTIYACLREIVRKSSGGRTVATLEDPIESALAGVSQSQVNERAGFDLATGLRSLLRQDPEVIAVGEMRDPATASIALQASLTGQLVLTSFHAYNAAAAISRLSDMGLEPYVLRSGILAVISQRLARRLCAQCREPVEDDAAKLELPIKKSYRAGSCPACHGTGYRGRLLLAEMLEQNSVVAAAILNRFDTTRLQAAAARAGMRTLGQRACDAVEAGLTTPDEIRRVLGFSDAFFPSAG